MSPLHRLALLALLLGLTTGCAKEGLDDDVGDGAPRPKHDAAAADGGTQR